MVHAVSTTSLRYEHMSPPAAGLALLLHASVALALFLVSPLKFSEAAPPEPIEVTMERPASPAAPQPEPPQPQPAPTAQLSPLPPPPPAAAQARPQAGASGPKTGLSPPEPQTAEKPVQPEPQTAEPVPQQAPPVTQTAETEKNLPQVATPAAPLTMQDFVRIAPPPSPQSMARRAPAPTPPPQREPLQNSPLAAMQPHEATRAGQSPSQGMLNPAHAAARNRVIDEYKWAVIRKFSQYLPNLRQKGEGGTLILLITIARDGRLLDVTISQSSGIMALDQGMVEAVRAASPYSPLPAEIPGERYTYAQDITAQR